MSDAPAIGGGGLRREFARLAARSVRPLLFALRLWASVCLALYVAFALPVSDPSWAATTAALICQPQLGASLRKGWFRLVGTVVGGVAAVLIAAAFPQDRVGFLTALALWSAACGFAGAVLKNFAAYGAALAGFTAAVIAGDVFGPTGGVHGDIATFAILRVVDIAIGIVSAGVVLALTDLGEARRRLGEEFAAVASAAIAGLASVASAADATEAASRSARREAMRRAIAVDPLIDAAIGEASDLRYRSRILQAALDGQIAVVSAWRTLALHLGGLSPAERRRAVAPIRPLLEPLSMTPAEAVRGAARLRDACGDAARRAVRLAADSPSSQLMADAAAAGLLASARALNGLTLIVDPRDARRGDALAALHVADWLPPTVVAVRAFLAAGLASLFWIATAWPSGSLALTFAIVTAVVFPLQGDRAYSAAMAYLVGAALSAVIAAILIFGVLPDVVTFPGLCLTLGLVYVPLGALVAWPAQPMVFGAAALLLMPYLGLDNVQAYDAARFMNSVVAILSGVAAGLILIRILPPPSPAARTRRLLGFALADVRNLARGRGTRSQRKWEGRMFARIVALPDAAEPIERSYMASALAVGTRMIRLAAVAPRFAPQAAIAAAFEPLADGRVAAALAGLEALERELTDAGPEARIVRRLRAGALALTEELKAYPEFFERRGRA